MRRVEPKKERPLPERGEFLLEVGCEEIPAGWLPGITSELGERFAEIAMREHLAPSGLVTLSTPRRLILKADVAARQPDREEQVFGPSLKLAKDAVGNWTKAALGFARKNGVEPAELQTAPRDPAKPEEQNLLFVRRIPGRPAPDVLAGLIAPLLRGLSFPKRMTWDAWLEDGKGAFPFGRPVRWLVALFDGGVVPFVIYANERGARGAPVVEAGDATRGHRFLPRDRPGAAPRVRSCDDLVRVLEQHAVIASREARLTRLREALAPVAAEMYHDHGLVAEWSELVEHPSVVFGTIPDEFHGLPRPVLETVLVHHQKYIPLLREGRVARFAAVTNVDGAAAREIVRGMERVVVARLRDAAFFHAEDLKRPLADRVADLAGVTFHQKLGHYGEKAERMVALVGTLREMGALSDEEHGLAAEAARLAKADLTTLMVREFTELQGVMGGLYLRAAGGVPEAVAKAVEWHYHPVSVLPEDPPAGRFDPMESRVFAAVSLVDKLDTLAGYFGIGLEPTGSSDPYGLRRAAQGVVRLLLDFWPADSGRRPRLPGLLAAALGGYGDRLTRPAGDSGVALEAFLLERLRAVLLARGFEAAEVEAALGARDPEALDDPQETLARVRALRAARETAREDIEHLGVAFKRARNILGDGSGAADVDPDLLAEDAERALHADVQRLRAQAAPDFAARLRELATLRAPVDRFFDDVLVMAEDPRVRANRLGLLQETLSLFYRIADISRLGG
jgi:glycyl-tRNA synthetase beta chain